MSGAVAPWVSRRADEHDVACRAFFEDDRLIYLHERPDDRAVCVPSVRGHSTPNSSGTTGRASRGAAGETAASGSPVVQGRIAYRRLPPAWRRVDAWRCPGRRAAPSRQCSPRPPAQPLPGEALVATGLSGLGGCPSVRHSSPSAVVRGGRVDDGDGYSVPPLLAKPPVACCPRRAPAASERLTPARRDDAVRARIWDAVPRSAFERLSARQQFRRSRWGTRMMRRVDAVVMLRRAEDGAPLARDVDAAPYSRSGQGTAQHRRSSRRSNSNAPRFPVAARRRAGVSCCATTKATRPGALELHDRVLSNRR
jgi:hypothetical protein